ncbi:MAG: O-antigen ligase family protein [Candidatus Sulfotelmatobacter sp.]
MATGTKPAWNPEPVRRASHPAAMLLKFLPFLLVGVVGSIYGGWLVMERGVSLALVSLALVLVIPVMWFGWVGLKEVWRVLVDFWPQVKWWHWVWFLSLSSSFVFRYRSASEISQSPVDSTAGLRLGPEVIVGLILLARLIFRKPDWGPSMTRGVVGSMAIFGSVCLLSSLWSVKFSWTLYKSLEYLLDLSIIAMILAIVRTTEEYKSFIDWTWVIAGVTTAWVWIGLPIWPQQSWAEESRLAGAYPIVSSNELGDTGAILILVAAIRYWPLIGKGKNQAFYILTALLGAATMIAAQTRSAFGGLFIAALVVLYFAGRTRYAIWGSILAVPAVIFTSVGPKIMSYLQRDQSAEEFATMSSRLDWWSIGYKMFMQHPFTGLGAYAGSRFAVLANIGAPQLHSDWLEVIVGTSIWGLMPFLISVIWIWAILIRYYRGRWLTPEDRQLTLEMIGVMAVITIHSFVNVEMTWHHPTLFLIVLGWAEFMRRRLHARSPGRSQLHQMPVLIEQQRDGGVEGVTPKRATLSRLRDLF